MATGNLNLMPMSADVKPRALHKLQGSIHFEKTLPATAEANYDIAAAELTIPCWFVLKHGDKFGEFSILRTESSTERWPVKVYAFRSTKGPHKNPSRHQRRRTCDTDHSRNKAKRPYYKCRDDLLSADEEGSVEGKNGSNTESSAVFEGAIAPTPEPSCKEDSSHQLPSFWKTLTATNVRGDAQARLEIPSGFCRKYGNRIRTVVTLQGLQEQSPERTVTCRTRFQKTIRHFLTVEWQDFVTENQLHEEQQLLFTLSADSFFVVRERSAL